MALPFIKLGNSEEGAEVETPVMSAMPVPRVEAVSGASGQAAWRTVVNSPTTQECRIGLCSHLDF